MILPEQFNGAGRPPTAITNLAEDKYSLNPNESVH